MFVFLYPSLANEADFHFFSIVLKLNDEIDEDKTSH
jgi:hypothetical protein